MKWKKVGKRLRSQFTVPKDYNEYGIEFYHHWQRELGKEVEVSYEVQELKGRKEVLAYSIYYDFMEDFAADFDIVSLRELDKITPDDLAKRFEAGQAKLFCLIGNDEYLYFFRGKGFLYAEDYWKEQHLVDELIVRIEDYVNYTMKYYEDLEVAQVEDLR